MNFKFRKILVTGGTGSFGHCLVDRLLSLGDNAPGSIIILSRDEKKQDDMRKYYSNDPLLKFVICDTRDRESVFLAMRGVDYVFHAAALKQVPSCELFPWEAAKTNIEGARNVLDAAEFHSVKKVVMLSTDKAVYPINAMGMTKALSEKLMIAKARECHGHTDFCGVRYGNVMCSRGSVIPLFIDQIGNGKPVTITSPTMTRFMLSLESAIDLVLFALDKGENGDMMVMKAPAATVQVLAEAINEMFCGDGIEIIGIRDGEKQHETLVTSEEMLRAVEYPDFYRVETLKGLTLDKDFIGGDHTAGYTSGNTEQLDIDGMKQLLLTNEYVRDRI